MVDNSQAILINTSFNFYKINSSFKSLVKDSYPVYLFLSSLSETRRVKIFLSSLCKWMNEKKQELEEDCKDLSPEEKDRLEGITSQHQIQSSFVAITQKRQSSFIAFFSKEVEEQKGEYVYTDKPETSELMKQYGATVPRLFIRLLSRMKEVKACDVHNIFRENGDIRLRDVYLKQLGEVMKWRGVDE